MADTNNDTHHAALPVEALFEAARALIDAGRPADAFALAAHPGSGPARGDLAGLLDAAGHGEQARALRNAIAVEQIPIVTVSYNAPDLIDALLASIRRFYPNPVYVIDGSRPEVAEQIRPLAAKYPDVRFIPFGYNIHHGPGMTWAIHNLGLHGPVLFLDSDVEVLRRGFLESLRDALAPGMYGVGNLLHVNRLGQPVEHGTGYLYLHPACMLCDIDVVRQWPLPIKHGAPMMPSMVAMHEAGRPDLVRNIDWVQNDFGSNPDRIFIKHDWQGTVIRTGGYHYDEPVSSQVDEQLLSLVPVTPVKVVEVGCGDGGFAKAYKARNPLCDYTGIEPDAALAAQARPHCDYVFNEAFGHDSAERQAYTAQADCWIVRGALGRLEDPAAWLAAVRGRMAPGATLVLSEPNAQHWRRQVLLNQGRPAAENRRPFTRAALLELLRDSGFTLSGGGARMADEPERERYLPALRALAEAGGTDPELALQDALPLDYLLVAVAA